MIVIEDNMKTVKKEDYICLKFSCFNFIWLSLSSQVIDNKSTLSGAGMVGLPFVVEKRISVSSLKFLNFFYFLNKFNFFIH